MRTIWKYRLEISGEQTLQMPRGAQILSVQAQGGTIVLYALVDPAKAKEDRAVNVVGTGFDITDRISADKRYLGTVPTDGGKFMWHVFA